MMNTPLKISLLGTVVGLLVCGACVSQVKQLSFDPPGTGFIGGAGRLLEHTVGDVDGDGDMDMLFGSLAIQVAVNDGTGIFSVSSAKIPKHDPADVYVVLAMADLDFDQDLDLMALTHDFRTMALRVWENDGKGGFTFTTKPPLPRLPMGGWGLAFGDLDDDGDNDIILGDYNFFWNNGQGVFSQKNVIPNRASTSTSAIALADFNKDGRTDILFGNATTNTEIWHGDGKGGFTLGHVFAVYSSLGAAVQDLNGDGWPDFVIESGGSVLVFLRTSAGGFTQTQALPAPVTRGPISAVDLDGDGDFDLALQGPRLFLNSGKGQFVDQTSSLIQDPNWGPGYQAVLPRLQAADLDGDGDADIGGLLEYRSGRILTYQPIVLRNLERHVSSPATVALSNQLTVGLLADDKHKMLMAISLTETLIPLGALGSLRLSPAAMVVLPPKTISNRVPQVWAFNVPNNSAVVGWTVRFQALDAAPNGVDHLTGVVRTEVTR